MKTALIEQETIINFNEGEKVANIYTHNKTWQRHLESPDDDKLAKLYTFYQQNQSLSGVKYINLRDPRQTIYLPIDKY